ncbi:SIMPL domain-containing protein [Xylophilus sp.]|uniref:SIMPL domain-containing protein n=1 Tax=Xylophilus sp. TaxID=2653893 RepID=UPI0013B9885B|nr:SIMPL domain-containing protein [Xylophilus sp.]KAF1047042.1 MAG: hypothetical protein GAK38_02086 [Xylophilus sp.]
MKNAVRLLIYVSVILGTATAAAQTAVAHSEPRNVVQLSANGTVEVQQDLLQLTLSTTREGAEPAAVQLELREALDKALARARSAEQRGQLDVRTGNFSIHPRYNKDGRIANWQGSVELVLEGRDFDRITSTAATIRELTLGQIAFGLSRAQRQKVEGEAQTQAIERFKARAGDLARGFGFTGYTLREVSVDTSDASPGPRPRFMAAEAKSFSDAPAPVPVQAGRSTVTVTVSGSVQMQ